jgi:hypothetical protein
MTISTTTLKNAAFAIECDLWTDPATGANYLAKDGAILRRWEPETSSADAFDLGMSLGMSIENREGIVHISRYRHREWSPHRVDQELGDDNLAAIRIAIILCAAEIGSALCQ